MKFIIIYQDNKWKIVRSDYGCEIQYLPTILERMKKQHEMIQYCNKPDCSLENNDLDMKEFREHINRTNGEAEFHLVKASE